MYHQFKQLADIDITKEPMEVGPTTHYVMGGVRVDAETQMSSVPGLFAAGECAAGINGANRLGGNSLSDLLVFGKRAGEFAAKYAQSAPSRRYSDAASGSRPRRAALEPFERGAQGEGPYQVQYALQEMMQDLVGIVRTKPKCSARSTGSSNCASGRARWASAVIANTTRAGTPRSICPTCCWYPRRSPDPRSNGEKAAAVTSVRIIPTRTRRSAR